MSLTSGAPSDVPYLYNVPGSVLVTAANSGTNGPYPTSLIGDYVPAGYTVDNVNCGGIGRHPSLAHGVALNGPQSLPSLNTALAQYGTDSPPTGTGRLHIRRADHDRARHLERHDDDERLEPAVDQHDHHDVHVLERLDVLGRHPFITGIALPSDGVIYVQNYTLPTGSPAPCLPATARHPASTPIRRPSRRTASSASRVTSTSKVS